MTTNDRIAKIRRQSLWLWAVFAIVTASSVAGNMAQAGDGWVTRVIAGTAAVTLFVMVEILVHVEVDKDSDAFRRGMRACVAFVAVLSFVVSYKHLQTLADRHGQGLASYAFPVFLDVVAIMCTVYLVHLARWRERLRAEHRTAEVEHAEQVRRRGGRPTEPGSVRSVRKAEAEQKALPSEPAPEQPALPAEPVRSDPNSIAERIIAEHGTEPNAWPGPTELAERLGCAKSTASAHRAKAAKLVMMQHHHTPSPGQTRVSSGEPEPNRTAEQHAEPDPIPA